MPWIINGGDDGIVAWLVGCADQIDFGRIIEPVELCVIAGECGDNEIAQQPGQAHQCYPK